MGKFTSADVEIKADDKTGKGIQSSKQKIGGLTKTVKAYGAEIAAVYLAVRKAYKTVQDLTQAWGVQEIAVIEMNNALRNTGIFTPMLSAELQDLASRLQTTTTYGDELTLSAIGMLQSLGELDQEMLKRAIPAVQDLAASLFKGDMITASSMFAKVVGSSTNSLSRYGIEIDMTGTKAEKFEELMRKVNEKFGGRSAELADSYTGKTKQLGNAYGDLKEAMGHVMANQMEPSIPLMIDITERMTDWINAKIELKEAYEDIKKPMQDANDQTRIEILQSQQLVAINTLRILLADKQDAKYTVMGLNLKTMNEERDREISKLQAIISGSEREVKALMDLIAARDEDNRKRDERKKKDEEEQESLEDLIASSDEWANTIIWTGQALDDYIEMCDSARESQQWLNEEIEKGEEDLTDYAAAMERVQENAELLKDKEEALAEILEEKVNEALKEQKELEEDIADAMITMASGIKEGGIVLIDFAKTAVKLALRSLGEMLLEMAAFAVFYDPLKAVVTFLAGTAAIAYANTLKEGGIVTEPTLALIGESGPEAVVPLNRGGIEPLNKPNRSEAAIMNPVELGNIYLNVYIGTSKIHTSITKAIRNKQILIYDKAIVTR